MREFDEHSLKTAALNERATARVLVGLGGAACGLYALTHLTCWGQAHSISEITDRQFFEAVEPITLGHTAASALIAALCVTCYRPDRVAWAFTIAAAVAAGMCLVLAGSRGPVIAFALCGILFAAGTGRWGWLALTLLLIVPQGLDADGELWRRFSTTAEDNSSLERLLLQGNAIQQFMARPLFGSAYVELELLSYPHNLMIETAMALGFVGIGVLAAVLWRAARNGVALIRHGNVLVPLLFAQYLVAAQFSGSIWGNASLWACAALLVGVLRPTPAYPAKPRRRMRRPNSGDSPVALEPDLAR